MASMGNLNDRPPAFSRSSSRLGVLFFAAMYVVFFLSIHIQWGSKMYFYFGFSYHENYASLSFAILLCALFASILKVESLRYSDFFCWMVYFILFVPTVLIVSSQGYDSFSPFALNSAVATSFLASAKIPDLLRQASVRTPRRLKPMIFFSFFFLIYFAALGYYIVTYRNIMSFSGVEEIYDQRARFGSADVSGIAIYLTGWLSAALNPYLLTVGLMSWRRWWMAVIGIVGQLIVYMAFAGKVMLAIILVQVGFRFFVLHHGVISITRLAFGFFALAVLPYIIIVQNDFDLRGWAFEVVALIFMRTLGMQGAMAGVYTDLFSGVSHTYYSHINVVRLFVTYPFEVPLGVVAGQHLVGGDGFNANANFWATDGIAALGYPGVILIGLVLGILLAFMNKLVTDDLLPFSAVLSIPFIMTLGNVSLFTSLLSGGGLFLVVLIAYGAPLGGAVVPRLQHARSPLGDRKRFIS